MIFMMLFIAIISLLGVLSTRYTITADWTANGRNTLSTASLRLLETLDAPIRMRAFLRDDATGEELRKYIRDVTGRYQRVKTDMTLEFVNPELEPQLSRDLGIRSEGEIIVTYKERSEHVQRLSEQSLSNALQRLARSGDRFVVFLEGHGERSPRGKANHDIGDLGKQLETKGFHLQTINLASTAVIPTNTAMLVIASPQVNLLPGEATLISKYLDQGGNLLWLAEPGETHGLDGIAEKLGIEFHPGMIVDPTTQLLGLSDPRFAIITEYGLHPITRNFSNVSLYPQAVAIDVAVNDEWQMQPLLITAANSWVETSELSGQLALDPGEDIPGPLTLGVALTRERNDVDKANGKTAEHNPEQRVIVIGDGDFISNAYLGNAGNLDLGLNIVNWLSRDDALIDIPAKTSTDRSLTLSATAQAMIGFGFLLILPLGLLAAGFTIWWRRRRA
jgi:ABC-type uncharacterized transport system involved in gliding motility auxiliary subunit